MTDSKQGTKAALKGTAYVLTFPVRSVISSFRTVGRSTKKTLQSIGEIGTLGQRANAILKDMMRSGGNDQFSDIFSGEEGEQLRQDNIQRFLKRKRWALVLTVLFVLYGMAEIMFHLAPFALVTVVISLLLGLTYAIEADFRLWQLRNRRLSREEKGSFPDYFNEESILHVLNPELGGGHD